MDFYEDEKNVEEYVRMAEGFDGRELIAILQGHLESGSTVLELGMGPGVDLDILAEHYTVTGSDKSAVFLERYRRTHPDAEVIFLDARTMELDRKFDCIYSNKVLHLLTRDELRESLRSQAGALKDGGILFHSFWQGEGEDEIYGMLTTYYTKEKLAELVGDEYKIVEIAPYAEMDDDDSLYLILKKV